jgi:TonB family protein
VRALLALVTVAMVLPANASDVLAQGKPLRLGTNADTPPPRRVTYVEPVYPAAAKAQKKEATVTLELELNEKGQVIVAKAIKGALPFTDSAVSAAKQWRYQPNGTERQTDAGNLRSDGGVQPEEAIAEHLAVLAV